MRVLKENNRIEFDTESIDEEQYKMMKLASFSNEELKGIDKEDQVLLTRIYLNKGKTAMVAMAPSAWFESMDDFKNSIKTQFKDTIVKELSNIADSFALSLLELIDHMGISSFISYANSDGFMTFCTMPCEEWDMDELKSYIYSMISTLSFCDIMLASITDNKDKLNTPFDEVNEFRAGFIDKILQEAYTETTAIAIRNIEDIDNIAENIKEAYAIVIELNGFTPIMYGYLPNDAEVADKYEAFIRDTFE